MDSVRQPLSPQPCYNGRTIPSPIRKYTLEQPEVA